MWLHFGTVRNQHFWHHHLDILLVSLWVSIDFKINFISFSVAIWAPHTNNLNKTNKVHIFLTVIPVFNLPLQKENTKLSSALGQWHNWANIDRFDLQRKKSTMTWAKSCLIIRRVIGYDPFLLPPSSGLCFHLQKLPKETKHAYIYICGVRVNIIQQY